MLIGKRGAAVTALSTATADRIEVRGRDLAGELMGATSFTAFYFLLTTGRTPTEEQRFFLDVALVAIAEHGLTPTVQAARMTYAADPGALQGAVAAGILGCGTVVLGTARLCVALLADALKRIDQGASPEAVESPLGSSPRATYNTELTTSSRGASMSPRLPECVSVALEAFNAPELAVKAYRIPLAPPT